MGSKVPLAAILSVLTALAGCAHLPARPQSTSVRIIFDTDMDTDCDDAGALAMLHAMADDGEIELLATMVSSRFPYSASAVDVINSYYGRPDLPVGVPKGAGASTDRGSRFARELAEEFPHDIASNAEAPDAVSVYRSILAAQPDRSVVIVSVGYLTNLSDLLRSGPDGHSPLTGRDLVARKVRHYVAMGSRYPADLDPSPWGNFKPHPEAVVHVAAEWPTTITFTGGGDFAISMATGARLATEAPADSPVRRAYEHYFGGTAEDRHSADQIATLVAVRGTGYPWRLVEQGYNHIFANGTHEWRERPDDPRHRFISSLAPGADPGEVAETIEDLMVRPPNRTTSEFRVAPADLSQLRPSDFSDDELDLPYYLAHFHRLANSVRMEGDDRGFIDISVWRRPKDNRPYNARVMENILSLTYFYTVERPWNPYRGDPAVRARLEAALEFWVGMQAPDGKFSEYGPGEWTLAPTAFATKFMGEALRLLADGPPIDPEIHRQAVAADRKAIMAVLTDSGFYRHGLSYSNQYGNVWPGALAYLDMYDDPELEGLLHTRMRQAAADHQSPVGFYYELDGADWGYNLGTHHSNVHMAWHYARGTEFGNALLAETRRWYDWFGYNAVPEPGQAGLITNRGVETRQRRPVVTASGQVSIFSGHEDSAAGFPLAEQIELARLLVPTREALAAARERRRAELERTWPAVDPLLVGEFSDLTGGFSAYSPYAFLHRNHVQWFPTDEQRSSALARLPYLARERFVHQRVDSRSPLHFTFVRHPAYFVTFNAGEILVPQQRYGLGLLWIPGAGAVLQSQTGTTESAWGSRAPDRELVYEAGTFIPTYRVNGREIHPETGNRDLPEGVLEVRYDLAGRGRKRVRFAEREIEIEVEHPGEFVEQIPLLLRPSDELREMPGEIELSRGGSRIAVRFDPSVRVEIERTDQSVGESRVVVVELASTGMLRYVIEVQGDSGLP